MLTPNDLSYPILALSRDGSIVPFGSPEALCRCNARALWRTRCYDGLHVFDLSGARARVEAAQPAGPANVLTRTVTRALNRPLSVALQLAPQGVPGLHAARAACLEWLEKDPVFWKASAELEEWRARIRGAASMRALITEFE